MFVKFSKYNIYFRVHECSKLFLRRKGENISSLFLFAFVALPQDRLGFVYLFFSVLHVLQVEKAHEFFLNTLNTCKIVLKYFCFCFQKALRSNT